MMGRLQAEQVTDAAKQMHEKAVVEQQAAIKARDAAKAQKEESLSAVKSAEVEEEAAKTERKAARAAELASSAMVAQALATQEKANAEKLMAVKASGDASRVQLEALAAQGGAPTLQSDVANAPKRVLEALGADKASELTDKAPQ